MIIWRTLLNLLVSFLFTVVQFAEAGEDTGEALYAQCIGCHSPGYNRTGPLHCGVVGRAAGSAPGFEYSKAMQQADFIWTKERLNSFLSAPLQDVPGTSMGFVGIADPKQRQQMINYLEKLTAEHPDCR